MTRGEAVRGAEVGAGSEPGRERPRETVAFFAYRAIAWLARVLPSDLGRRVFMRLGELAHALLPRVRAVVAANQARVLGRPVSDELVRRATKEAFRSYARYWFDAFDLIGRDDEWVRARFGWDGFERFGEALEEGRGVVAVLPHFGNWDAAGRAMAAMGRPIVSVAERLRPERLNRLFLAQRAALGMEIVGLEEEGVARRLGAALAANRIVALVADRDLSGGGIEVEMFGAPRRLPVGPALLALSAKAPLLVAAPHQTPDGWRCWVSEPLPVPETGSRRQDVVALTREIAARLEAVIASDPTDWHMFQPGWD
jgi:KDO2-lipid IV(A) lauroyltransferase